MPPPALALDGAVDRVVAVVAAIAEEDTGWSDPIIDTVMMALAYTCSALSWPTPLPCPAFSCFQEFELW